MEIGIPNYLKPYLVVTKAPKNIKEEFSITGSLKCTCGAETFIITRDKWVQSPESREAEKKIEALYEKHRKNILQKNGTLCETGSEDGKWCISYITYDGGEKKKILEDITELRNIANSSPLVPTIFEATCPHCGKKILVFNSSLHGYNGLIETLKNNCVRNYKTVKKLKCRKCGKEESKISITISSTGKNDLIAECSKFVNEKNWEDAFDWITIDLKCICGKETKKYLDLETM